jgi:hypothetical protein
MDSLRFYGHLSVLMIILSQTQALIYLRLTILSIVSGNVIQ